MPIGEHRLCVPSPQLFLRDQQWSQHHPYQQYRHHEGRDETVFLHKEKGQRSGDY